MTETWILRQKTRLLHGIWMHDVEDKLAHQSIDLDNAVCPKTCETMREVMQPTRDV